MKRNGRNGHKSVWRNLARVEYAAAAILVGLFLMSRSDVRVSGISPQEGYIGTTVTLTGEGFLPEGNRVMVKGNPYTLQPSDNGRISFAVRKWPCAPGEHCRIWVENSSGHSNAVSFRLTDHLSPDIRVQTLVGSNTFTQGAENLIGWRGGRNRVAVMLLREDASNEVDIAATRRIVGYINTNEGNGFHLPNSVAAWDGRTVCDPSFDPGPDRNCRMVAPGTYRVAVGSEDAEGRMMVVSAGTEDLRYEPGAYRGNWDVNPNVITIRPGS